MKFFRALLVLPALLAAPAHATEDAVFGHALTLVQELLAGRNAEASRAFEGLLQEATAGMPAEHRDKVASISRDLAARARTEIGRGPALDAPSIDRALQARKDLTAMGLRYYDASQFLDAVRRDDALAAELFLAGRGVNASAKGKDGRTALDIARANGNERMAALLSRNLP